MLVAGYMTLLSSNIQSDSYSHSRHRTCLYWFTWFTNGCFSLTSSFSCLSCNLSHMLPPHPQSNGCDCSNSNGMRFVQIQYFIPFGVISFVYIQMAIRLWGSKTPGNAQDSRDVTLMRNKKRVCTHIISRINKFLHIVHAWTHPNINNGQINWVQCKFIFWLTALANSSPMMCDWLGMSYAYTHKII